jgi:hypothetical protein
MACPVVGGKHAMVLQFAQPVAILWGFEKDWKRPEAAFMAFSVPSCADLWTKAASFR